MRPWNRFYEKAVALRSREHAALHRLRAEHPERAPEGARPGGIPVRALPRTLQRRRRRVHRGCVGRADLRLVAHRRDLRRHRRGGHAPVRRGQLHAQRAGVRRRRSRTSSGTTTGRPTSARPPAPTATGASGSRSWPRSSATSRTATAPTRSARTGTSRCGTSRRGCTRSGDNGYFELYETPWPACCRAIPECAWAVRPARRASRRHCIRSLITGALNTGTKLDFVTYHRYGDDDGLPIADVTDAVAFHANIAERRRHDRRQDRRSSWARSSTTSSAPAGCRTSRATPRSPPATSPR